MIRTHARIWIGLLACLLMQVGLLLGTSTAQARSEAPRMAMAMHHMAHHQKTPDTDCCKTSAFHAIPHPQQSSEGCCHTHVVSTEPMLTTAFIHPSGPIRAVSRAFASGLHDRFSGTDWIPASPPPRLRAI
ncbi:hypothetical protein JK202_00810 [Gluconobacter sp. Dm-62]|uniref:hypothetical protein n=1 Tax=Gluconobacter sp. Dm-62 TaxID=2799804 RepID=UPI001B8CFC6C|nr:hypothetical protein [Gluconobacter sp. Dm-62]MBS1101568.1 hypothetical protein [Gluconobacter sp. Dm-62]